MPGSAQLDWPRLLARFGPHWRVLLSHLILFGFIYPGQAGLVPSWVMIQLLQRLQQDPGVSSESAAATPLCAGTLLSRAQYLHDIEMRGYADARLQPHGRMSPNDVKTWTDAISPQGSG